MLHMARKKESAAAPDFLLCVNGTYFEQNGFCFTVVPAVDERNVCWMEIYYQNRYDQPCVATVAVKPPSGFWIARSGLTAIVQAIEVGPGAFGVVSVPWPIPAKLQGTQQRLAVGATAKYPRKRKCSLRSARSLRVHAHNFHDNGWIEILVLVISLGGVSLSKPAGLSFILPTNVVEEIPANLGIEAYELWRLGDDIAKECAMDPYSVFPSNRARIFFRPGG
jgi:hypothetical protein